MKLSVRGKNGFIVTDAIEQYIDKKLSKLDQYLLRDAKANVLCQTYNDHHRVEVTIPTQFYTMRVDVRSEDMYAAVDLSIDKLEAQIRKHKTKINRSLQSKEGVSKLFVDELDIDALEKELLSNDMKIKTLELEELTKTEAMTAIEMIDHDFYVFKDYDTKRVSVIYRRKNGGYGVLETQ